MARPIEETPILTGQDAEEFVAQMERVEALSDEVRASNREKFLHDFKEALKTITLCF